MGTSRRTTIPRLQLDITQEMIDTAVPRDSGHCMIADAVKAAYPSATRISVDIQSIRFSDPLTDKRYVYLTPRTGQVALLEFDRGIHPVPFGLRPTGIQVVPIHHDHRDGTRTKVQKSALRPPSQAGGH